MELTLLLLQWTATSWPLKSHWWLRAHPTQFIQPTPYFVLCGADTYLILNCMRVLKHFPNWYIFCMRLVLDVPYIMSWSYPVADVDVKLLKDQLSKYSKLQKDKCIDQKCLGLQNRCPNQFHASPIHHNPRLILRQGQWWGLVKKNQAVE